jgi:hypothetical protein
MTPLYDYRPASSPVDIKLNKEVRNLGSAGSAPTKIEMECKDRCLKNVVSYSWLHVLRQDHCVDPK